MRSLSLAASLILVAWRSFAADSSTPLQNPEQAYQQLLSIKCFAFGGVGYAGIPSRGELCFKKVLSSANALQRFKAVLTNGTPEGKLYALFGIRQIFRSDFAAQAESVLKENPRVTTMSGCIMRHEPATNVVARIAAGYYD